MPVQNYTVDSTALAAIAYDEETGACFITFKDGKSYTIPKLPGIEFHRWMNAESKGSYWNLNLRGRY